MTQKEAQKLYKWDVRIDPATGLRTVYAMPDDVILNTRRAFSGSTTSLTGYSDLGVPEGRYFAPANSADCIQLKAGDCAPRTVMLRAPFFTRFDIGVTKRFPIAGRVELRAARRRPECLRQHQLQRHRRVAHARHRRDDLPDQHGVYGPEQRVRPWRPSRQLVFRLNW